MSPKTMMTILVLVLSSAGSYLPVLWGGSIFGFASLIGGSVGAIAGIWLTFKLQGY